MLATTIIAKKRDGLKLTKEEIEFMVNGFVNDDIANYQISSFLMASLIKGLDFEETGFLTRSMINTGRTYEIESKKPLIDKHSTGGVGDKISLVLAPLVASMGIDVPMMSGRALGITGGTLDKLESIEGYSVFLSEDRFKDGIAKNGFAMIGQNSDIVPADKLLYALRDVTATVESVSLITASILSKKFAEGSKGLVFDVKCGSGAFMKTEAQAEELATSLVNTAKSLDRKAYAIITRMDEVLGYKVGNFLEIEESIECLQGSEVSDIMELVYEQAAAMAMLGGIVDSLDKGIALAKEKIADGSALQRLYSNIMHQGGNVAKLKAQIGTRRADYSYNICATKSGYLAKIDAEKIGLSGIMLGVGRSKTEDRVDFEAGYIFSKKGGDKVEEGDVIATIFASNKENLAKALPIAIESISYTDEPIKKESLIIKHIV